MTTDPAAINANAKVMAALRCGEFDSSRCAMAYPSQTTSRGYSHMRREDTTLNTFSWSHSVWRIPYAPKRTKPLSPSRGFQNAADFKCPSLPSLKTKPKATAAVK
ncbi:MAG: hypothetical protein FJX86_06380 [Bacteroidetes bacterium]|nr:hypothetical protein [Bacteroidota bacterium]